GQASASRATAGRNRGSASSFSIAMLVGRPMDIPVLLTETVSSKAAGLQPGGDRSESALGQSCARLGPTCFRSSAALEESGMAKSDRLFRVLHLLRSLPPPVTAARLAEAAEVSQRTLYRDIEALRASGALIDGEAGYGYRLTEDPALPPQMFSRLEVEALALGLAEVRATSDPELSAAAGSALAKISASLPERVQQQVAHAILMVYRYARAPQAKADPSAIRHACWEETALDI